MLCTPYYIYICTLCSTLYAIHSAILYSGKRIMNGIRLQGSIRPKSGLDSDSSRSRANFSRHCSSSSLLGWTTRIGHSGVLQGSSGFDRFSGALLGFRTETSIRASCEGCGVEVSRFRECTLHAPGGGSDYVNWGDGCGPGLRIQD